MNKEKLIEEMAKIIATAKNCEALALTDETVVIMESLVGTSIEYND